MEIHFMKITTLSDALKAQFGTKVYKLSLSSGCTCPNRDGTLGYGGCNFCSEGGSGEFAASPAPISQQIEEARRKVDAKMPSGISPEERKYIAYFQSYTNTYGDPVRLRALYEEAIRHPQIAALSIGTRPDCLPPEILDMLRDLNRIKPVWVELGLQTMHEKTAAKIHRGYSLPVFEEAYQNLKQAGITVIVHVILGLPGEQREDMLGTVRYLAELTPALDGIKLQNLQILRGTECALLPESELHIFTLEEYAELLVDCLRLLPEETVIHRLTGDGPRDLLIAPKWSLNKKHVLNTIHKYIREA